MSHTAKFPNKYAHTSYTATLMCSYRMLTLMVLLSNHISPECFDPLPSSSVRAQEWEQANPSTWILGFKVIDVPPLEDMAVATHAQYAETGFRHGQKHGITPRRLIKALSRTWEEQKSWKQRKGFRLQKSTSSYCSVTGQ